MRREQQIDQAIQFLSQKHPFQSMILDYVEFQVTILFPHYKRKREILLEDLKENDLQRKLIFQHYSTTFGIQSLMRLKSYFEPNLFDPKALLYLWAVQCVSQRNNWNNSSLQMIFDFSKHSAQVFFGIMTGVLLSSPTFLVLLKYIDKPFRLYFILICVGCFVLCLTFQFLKYLDNEAQSPRTREGLIHTYEKKLIPIFTERQLIQVKLNERRNAITRKNFL